MRNFYLWLEKGELFDNACDSINRNSVILQEMASLDSFRIFRSKMNRNTPIEIIASYLNELRLGLNCTFYMKLNKKEKYRLHYFMWTDLHNMWLQGSPQIKVAAASTIGHILIYITPYFPDDFMITLTGAISNFKYPSILLFSCYCYISKFFSTKEIENYSKNIVIFHLISLKDSHILPKLANELLFLPKEILYRLVEFFLNTLEKDPDNNYVSQTAHIIVSQNPQNYANLIKGDSSLPILASVFGEKLPKLKGQIVDALVDASLQVIQDFEAPLKNFSGACKVLSALITNKQVPFEIVHGIFNKDTIQKTVSMEDLLLLPIEPDIVYSIYGNQNFTQKTLTMDSSDLFFNTQSEIGMSGSVIGFDGYDEDGIPNLDTPNVSMQPMNDLKFLPSLPLPEVAGHDSRKHNDQSKWKEKSPEMSPSMLEVKPSDLDDSPSPSQLDYNDSNISDLSSLPPPSIPMMLSGEKVPSPDPSLNYSSQINIESISEPVPPPPIESFPKLSQDVTQSTLKQTSQHETSEHAPHISPEENQSNNPLARPPEQALSSLSSEVPPFYMNRPSSISNFGNLNNDILMNISNGFNSLANSARHRKIKRHSSIGSSMVLNELGMIAKMPPISRLSSKGIPLENYASFISSQSSIDVFRLEPRFVVPLMTYFKRFPQYQNELCNLILYSISSITSNKDSQSNDTIYAALKVITESQQTIQSEPLNCILYEVFSLKTEDVGLKVKILELIGALKGDVLTRVVADKLNKLVDEASISKIEILQKHAKKAFVSFSNHTSMDLFKFFFDMYVQKLDIFDETTFSRRLSFIAYVIHHIPGNWSLSFISLAAFLDEAISIFTFHRRILLDILKVMTAFAPRIQNHNLLLPFIKQAVNVIESNYCEYSGSPVFSQKTPLFENSYSRVNTLVSADIDPISNPKLCHRTVFKCGIVAYSFLANIQWNLFNLTKEDKQVLTQIIVHCAPILPKETCDFLTNIHDMDIIAKESLDRSLNLIVRSIKTGDDIIAFSQLFTIIHNKFSELNKTDALMDKIIKILPTMSNLTYAQILALKQLLAHYNVKVDSKIFENIIHPNYLHKLLNGQLPDDNNASKILDMDNEEEENLENIVILDDNELSSLVVSITPLVYANLDISPELLLSPKVICFCQNSTAFIDEEQCNQLFDFALNNLSSRTLFYILRYSQKYHYDLKLEEKLDNPIIHSKRMFQTVFISLTDGKHGFDSLSILAQKYLRELFCGDFSSYVLNAAAFERKNAIMLLKFDPPYFLNKFKQIQEFTKQQLANLCIYTQNVRFPHDDYFEFIIHLVSRYSDSASHRNIVRRILTIWALIYGSKLKTTAKELYSLIHCELGDLKTTSNNNKLFMQLTAADFVEFCYGAIVASKFMECTDLTDKLTSIFGKSTPYYHMLHYIYHTEVNLEILQEVPNYFLTSIKVQVMNGYGKYLKNNHDYKMSFEIIQELTGRNWNNISPNSVPVNESYILLITNLLLIDLPYQDFKLLFKCLFDNLSYSINSSTASRCIGLFKTIDGKIPARSDLHNDLISKLNIMLGTSQLPNPNFCDIFAAVAKHAGKFEIFVSRMKDYIVKTQSYSMANIAESVALHLMQASNDVSEANNVLPEIPDFYTYFNAIVSMEKKNRSMVHLQLQKKYKGAHLRALEMLKEPKFRLFAPLLALIKDDIEVPEKLKEYLSLIERKIQREHVTDTYHEF
ncbi:hypothetical protein TRFO_17079 [Tritrichomonas foetus]|uniref:Uncharacterized protein n=1 Tax=Tritrichomonas foetus TaxID=1144522 RepID=A0A1J4KNW5_9EUKA|nr:hypothetical protein TRFO_17079 [Tritrichomonas foetus]|eukprot:OHT12923.1 hypothetical protein TRFO_17079 [Tritrichomonas foetus]